MISGGSFNETAGGMKKRREVSRVKDAEKKQFPLHDQKQSAKLVGFSQGDG